jgi:hypothetical protein
MKLRQIYFGAFVVGTIVPTYFAVTFMTQFGMDIPGFIKGLFANYASSTFSSDLLLSSFIFWIFMYVDSKNRKVPHVAWFILLNLCIGLSSALPLYLYFREKADDNAQ